MDKSEPSKGECEIDKVLTSLAIRDDDGTSPQGDETGIEKNSLCRSGCEKKEWILSKNLKRLIGLK